MPDLELWREQRGRAAAVRYSERTIHGDRQAEVKMFENAGFDTNALGDAHGE
jgi:hypothetical protein